ncbi:TPA: hypothetical protein ACX6SN_000492 [Photobacterium damselae]
MSRSLVLTILFILLALFIGYLFLVPDEHKQVQELQPKQIKVPLERFSEDDLDRVIDPPSNFHQLQQVTDTIDQQLSDIYVEEPSFEQLEQFGTAKNHQTSTLPQSITIIDQPLWHFHPQLKKAVVSEQQITELPDENYLELDSNLLDALTVGDQLDLALPGGEAQTVIITNVSQPRSDLKIVKLANQQGRNIGNITQFNNTTEGQIRSDDDQEYHLRTTKQRGWIASKEALSQVNDPAVKNNSDPFTDLIQ